MGFINTIGQYLGVLSPAHISIFTFTKSREKIGQDVFGNTYYRGKPINGYKRDRRWVIYNGAPDASKVPAEWHGWLHHQTNEVPSADKSHRRKWQKPHQPNMTGTTAAYRPPGHILEGGKRDKATGDYEAWTPAE